MAKLKVQPTAAEGSVERLAELVAMSDPRRTAEWQAWHAWRSERERALVGGPADVRLALLPASDPRHQECRRRRDAWRAQQREYLAGRGLPVAWAERKQPDTAP